MRIEVLDRWQATLAQDVLTEETTITVDAGGADLEGAAPAVTNSSGTPGRQYLLTLIGESSEEVVTVTGASGNSLTVIRGDNPQSWPAGTPVEMRFRSLVVDQMARTLVGPKNPHRPSPETAATLVPGLRHTATVAPELYYAGPYSVVAGFGAYSHGASTVVIGRAAAVWGGGDKGIDEDGIPTNPCDGSVVVGRNTESTVEDAVVIGAQASIDMWPANPGDDLAHGAICGGQYAYLSWNCRQGILLGADSMAGSAPDVVLIGPGCWAGNADESVGVGAHVNISASYAVAAGPHAEAEGEGGSQVGAWSFVGANYGVALGFGSSCNIEGGAHIAAIPYLPSIASQSLADISSQPKASRACAAQVILATDPLDLGDGSAAVSLDLPAGVSLFPDAVDVIVVGSATPGGSPEVAVLGQAPQAVTVTDVGQRQALTLDSPHGITEVTASTSVAGTGTLSVRVVVRGCVVEVA